MSKWPYSTQRWQRLRRAKLAEDPACRYCLEQGRVTPANTVDHRVAISKGGAVWDWANLVSCCTRCHNAKRLHVERLGRARIPVKGCDIHGRPVDVRHWWNRGR